MVSHGQRGSASSQKQKEDNPVEPELIDSQTVSQFECKISGIEIAPGETRAILLKVSESFLSTAISIPVTVIRGWRDGPTAFVTAAVHGDEINGIDIVRRLMFEVDPKKLSGTLIAIPVVNIPGFLEQSRYLPYHRDLNRFFPGKKKGNNAERIAWKIFKEVISKCDFGIDLHTAARGRLNLPHVRGDMSHPMVRTLARAFDTTIIMHHKGLRGSLRKEATRAGVPTILFEAGETGKFSHRISGAGFRGVISVLAEMGMLKKDEKKEAPFQVIVKSSEWIRAEKGGILDLDVKPGDLTYKGDTIGSVLNPFGKTVVEIKAPATGIIVGVTTEPLTIPGTGIIHLARLKKTLAFVERSLRRRKRLDEEKMNLKRRQKDLKSKLKKKKLVLKKAGRTK